MYMSLIHYIIINKQIIDWVIMYKNKMGVVDIKGGFGNQLFQISFAKYLIDNDINVYLNTRNFERSKSIKNLQVDLRELVLPINIFEMEEISNVKFKIIETIQNISRDRLVKNLQTII